MALTEEQQSAVAASLKHPLVLVPSIAGSGKSYLLTHVAQLHGNENCMYLVFNKEMEREAREKFHPDVRVSTSAALAYYYVVKLGNRDFQPNFGVSQITEKYIDKRDKEKVIYWFEKFCQSKYVNLVEFCETEPKAMKRIDLIRKYLLLMVKREIPSNFSFNMKYFHILLHKNKVDLDLNLLMLDEVQDSSTVVLEIFKLIKAKHKIAVGDAFQTLYSFTGSINGFEYLKDQNPKVVKLTRSFRVTEEVAKKVEQFGKLYLDPDFEFKGTDGGIDNGITAYLSRSNSALIQQMIIFHRENIPYRLTRSVTSIFEAVKVIMYLNRKGVYNPKYSFLNRGIDSFYAGKTLFTSLRSHIKEEFNYNTEIQSAINIVNSVGTEKLKETIDLANRYVKLPKYKTSKTLLATSFTTKGMTFGTVHINKDVLPKEKILDLQIEDRKIEETELLNLLYVSTTRCNGPQDTTLIEKAIEHKLNN